MASTVKHLRSSTASKRPTASGLSDGQLGINTASGTPGVFFKDSGGVVVKVGPAHVGSTAPNATPAGSAGNSLGELWVDNSTTINGLNYFTGSAFVNLTPSGTTTVAGLVELATDAETQTGTDIVRAVTPSGLQSKVSDSISTTSSTTIASATAVKTAYDLANAALPKSGGRVTGELEIGPAGSLVFEGSTDDGFETTIAVVNPTADRTVTLPNVTGTVITTGDSGTVTSTMIVDGTIVNADINASAAIVDTKLATISTAGKVSNSATTATNANTGSAIVARDGSGNFTAGTITAALTGAASANVLKAGDTMTGALVVPLASAATPSLTFTGDLNTGIYSPAADQVAISTNGTGRLFVNASGNVSIGTNGTSSASEALCINSFAGFGDRVLTNPFVLLGNTGSGAGLLGTYSNHALEFRTNNTERMRLDTSGRLGLGTSSPNANLTVAGTDNSTLLTLHGATGTTLRGLAISTFANLSVPNAGVNFNALQSTAGALRFSTLGTTRMHIDEAGRVGIGTTSPDALLTVNGIGAFGAGAVTTPSIAATGDLNTGFWFPAADTIAASTAGSERARIDSSGRLLVGTSSSVTGTSIEAIGTLAVRRPAAAAEVGFWRANGTVGSPTAVGAGEIIGRLYVVGYDGTNYINAARIEVVVDGTPGTNDMPGRLVFSVTADGSASPTEAMRINNAGELLIGYTADNGAYKLQVNSQIFATSATVATSDGRYKENVASLGGCLDLVKALRPVSFTWKQQQDITRTDDEGNEVLVREGHDFPEGTQVGFIAQEVQEVLTDKPWLNSVIKENVRPAVLDSEGNELAPEEQFYGIAEGNLIAVLTNALQEAVGKIETLTHRVAALEAQ